MSSTTLTMEVPYELAERLRPLKDRWSRIMELGLRELDTTPPGFTGTSDVLEFLASLPTPQEILALRPSAEMAARVSALLEKNRTQGLSPDEQAEWDKYQYLEHLVRMAKARAALKLKQE